MQKIEYDKYGGPELMRLEEVEPPVPGKGRLLVRVRAAAANPMDWKIRNGAVKIMTGRRFPRGLGHDFAGTVVAVGEGVMRFRAGDEVFGAMSMKDSGAFAEMVAADENQVVKKPAGLSYEEAAVLPTVGVTALQSVIGKRGLRAGQSVFINGCLGGVGRAAAQIALMHGASAAGSCRDTAAADARALGIDPVVGFEFDPEPLKGRFDLVFDTVGTMPFSAARTLLKPGGRIVDINMTPAKLRRAVFSPAFQAVNAKYTRESLESVSQAAAEGKLAIPVARTVPLTQAIGALTELESRHTPKGGKLVIVPQVTT
jgi:NADPH:quinone reductase-like Zn-dependent oxidoreductase